MWDTALLLCPPESFLVERERTQARSMHSETDLILPVEQNNPLEPNWCFTSGLHRYNTSLLQHTWFHIIKPLILKLQYKMHYTLLTNNHMCCQYVRLPCNYIAHFISKTFYTGALYRYITKCCTSFAFPYPIIKETSIISSWGIINTSTNTSQAGNLQPVVSNDQKHQLREKYNLKIPLFKKLFNLIFLLVPYTLPSVTVLCREWFRNHCLKGSIYFAYNI